MRILIIKARGIQINIEERKNMAKFYPSIILRHQVLLYLNFYFSVEAILVVFWKRKTKIPKETAIQITESVFQHSCETLTVESNEDVANR
jgi:hypothetical protein